MNTSDCITPPDAAAIARAAEIIRAGGLVAFPTETVYGLGANALDAGAVRKIYAAKGRPAANPLIIHIASAADLGAVAAIEPQSKLAEQIEKLAPFWPGPLSLVLPRRANVPDQTTAGLPSVAVRVPRHPAARALIEAAGVPIAAPSANVSTYISPTTALHVAEGLGAAVDLILDGGPCDVGVESTIVSLVHAVPTVLRHGGITLEQLRAALGVVEERAPDGHSAGPLLSPGLMRQHYSPRTPLAFTGEIRAEDLPARVALVRCAESPSRGAPEGIASVVDLSPQGDLNVAARELFAALRRLDRGGYDLILVEPCAPIGLGRAIMDRLTRAAARGE